MKKMMLVLSAMVLGGCCFWACDDAPIAAVSPDGRNEIRLYTEPLSYEVLRDGVVVAAKSAIGLKVDGRCLCETMTAPKVTKQERRGSVRTAVYKKARVSLAGNETTADFGDWSVRLAARDDGVAYRFETRRKGEVTVNCEKATLRLPDAEATCWANFGGRIGCEETLNETLRAAEVVTGTRARHDFVYLPFTYAVDGKVVSVTESDVFDYPIWNLTRAAAADGDDVAFDSLFAKWPTKTRNVNYNTAKDDSPRPLRKKFVDATADYLVKTAGTRTFPWRTFILADAPSKLCEADIVYALARPAPRGADFNWVKPGKVAWDWWNAFDNLGDKGCNTKTYERFIDFAAKTGVEYVIFDEGWSETLNIWKYHPDVDVPHLIKYAEKKGVGIILWIAWAQAYGEEEKVAAHFAKLGAKGFKVDFMDRGDADVERFLWKFAKACAANKMVIDYHGAHRPTGMQRMYPNVLNFEGVHGLECMKWYQNEACDFMANDVKVFFGRMTAGPMDYTPGAMDNYPINGYPKRVVGKGGSHDVNIYVNPGSVGTRCHQMAMMALYEAPLQMLSDSPTKYEKNMECFSFMSAVPVVWDDTVGLGGCPDSFAALARRRGRTWYAAGISNAQGRTFELDTSFLERGQWQAEVFRDGADSDVQPTHYVHEQRTVWAGEKITLDMAPGGGFIIRFTK